MDGAGRERAERGGEQLGVREVEIGRVVQVDVAVLEVVELQHASCRPCGVGEHRRTEIGALDLAARVGCDVGAEGSGADDGECSRPNAGRASCRTGVGVSAGKEGENDAEQNEASADEACDRGGGDRGHQEEARCEGADDRSCRAERTYGSDRSSGLFQRRYLHRRQQRCHRREHGGRQEEPDGGEPDHHGDTSPVGVLGERPHDRNRGERERAAEPQRRTEEMLRGEPVGETTAGPASERNSGKDDADDGRVGLQRHADIRSQQATGEDLHHQDRG